MKDIDGTLVHSPTRNMAIVGVSPPSALRTTVDAMKAPMMRIGTVAVPTVISYEALSTMFTYGIDHGGFIAFMMAGLGPIAALFAIVWQTGGQFDRRDSLLNRSAGRFLPSRSIAKTAARSIAAEWNKASISTVSHVGKSIGLGSEKRMTDIRMPNGAGVIILHRYDGRTLIVLQPVATSIYDFDPDASLGAPGVAAIMDVVERIQLDRASLLLGVRPGMSAWAMSRLLAEALPSASKDTSHTGRDKSLYGYDVEYLVEKRRIDSVGIVVTSIRQKNDDDHVEVLVEAPGIGVLSLPTGPFSAVMGRRRGRELASSFGAGSPEIMTLPVFLGNARATRIAELAGRALAADPTITDGSGAPLRALIDQHMPRLLSAHRESTRTARSSDIAEIDATLDRGLDVVAGALGEAIDRLADRNMDALRTEVRFLESRHPDQTAAALGLAAA